MSSRPPTKISLVPKKHHGFQVVIFLLGCILPPLGECAPFGHGSHIQSAYHLSMRACRKARISVKSAGSSELLNMFPLVGQVRWSIYTYRLTIFIAAVALRFGVGTDLLVNTILCICGCECSLLLIHIPWRLRKQASSLSLSQEDAAYANDRLGPSRPKSNERQ